MSQLAAENPMTPRGNFMWFLDPSEGTVKIFKTIYPNQLKLVMVFGVFDATIPQKLLTELPNIICDYLEDKSKYALEPELLERVRSLKDDIYVPPVPTSGDSPDTIYTP